MAFGGPLKTSRKLGSHYPTKLQFQITDTLTLTDKKEVRRYIQLVSVRKIITPLLIILVAIVLVINIPLNSDSHSQINAPAGTQPVASLSSTGVPTYYGFPFPYNYNQPTVPKSVGVQGTNGPTVPLGQIGVTQAAGPTGHAGPVNITDPLNTTMAGTISSVSVHVYDGTLHPLSRTPGTGVQVKLQNISLYRFYSSVTSNQGYANFTLSEGWYYLTVGQGNGHLGFSQEINVNSPNFAIARYLMPSSNNTVQSPNNGPSSALRSGTVYVYSASGYPAAQVSVSVHNGSASGQLLFGGVTDAFGYLNYSGLSSQFTYYYQVTGYRQSATGVVTGYTNTSGSFSAGGTLNIALHGRTGWTATVTGSAPQQGYVNTISVTSPLTFTGGEVYLSAPLSTQNYNLKFVNTRVYFNSSVTWSASTSLAPSMYFVNSTVFMLSNQNIFGYAGGQFVRASFNNTLVFFSTLNVSAAAYKSANQAMGPYINATSSHSIFESAHISNADMAGITGRFVDSVFYRFNMTSSNPPNPNPPQWTTVLDRVYLLDSNLVATHVYIDNSVLNRLGYINVGVSMVINQSYVDFHVWNGEAALTWSSVKLTHDSIRPYAATYGNGDGYLNPASLNMSYTYINATPRGVGLGWYSLTFAPVHGSYFNNYVIDYPNITTRRADIGLLTGSYSGWGSVTFHDQYMNMNSTLLYGMDSISFSPPHHFDMNFSRTNFSNGWSDQEWNPFEWFAGIVTPFIPTGTFNNCTFYGIHYDPTIWWKQYNVSTDVNIAFWQDLNVPNPPSTVWGRIYMNYSDIYNVGIGTNLPHSFGAMEGGIATYFDHNIFFNNPSAVFTKVGTSGWYNGSYFQAPIAANIGHTSGHLILTNNWFLNLTNQTVPAEGISWNGGQGTNVTMTLAGNHFFYYPNKLESYIPVYTTPPSAPFNNNTRYAWPPGESDVTHPVYSYEIPMYKWGYFAAGPYQPQYVFNSTVLQQNPVNSLPNSVYAYVIEPDINTSSGRPVVSFMNGLAGGIQPNFTWNGSSYQLAVEQNMTFISAQRVSAASVGLQFQVPVGLGMMDVWMYNSTSGRNQLVTSVPEGGTQITVTVTYDPSSMPLGAVFFTNTTAKYTITFGEHGLPPGTEWSVSLGGVTSPSTGANITFEVQQGTYQYEVRQLVGFNSSPVGGNVTVAGSNATVYITWSSNGYPVTFIETGLSGQNWTVTLNGVSSTGSSSTISFAEPNGTYQYSIQPPENYSSNDSAGSLTVLGQGRVMYVSFAPANSSQTGSPPPPVTPPNQPPIVTSNPPPASGGTGSGYRTLIIQLIAIALAPSVMVTFYMIAHLANELETRPKMKKKIVFKFKKIRRE